MPFRGSTLCSAVVTAFGKQRLTLGGTSRRHPAALFCSMGAPGCRWALTLPEESCGGQLSLRCSFLFRVPVLRFDIDTFYSRRCPLQGGLLLPAAQRRQRRPLRQHLHRLARAPAVRDDGQEPSSWDDWDDEGELAAQSSPAAAAWAGWYTPSASPPAAARQRRQEQQQQQQSDASLAGREGETQQLEASTRGRGEREQQQSASAGAGAGAFRAAPAPHHHAGQQVAHLAAVSHAIPPPPPRPSGVEVRYFTLGAIAAVALHYLINFAGTLPVVRSLVQQFVWWHEPKRPALPPPPPGRTGDAGARAGASGSGTAGGAVQYSEDEESVEWVNMCWRKVRRGRGLGQGADHVDSRPS